MKKLLVMLSLALGLMSLTTIAQVKPIKGKVISKEDGMGLPGVNVAVKGTTIGTATDGNGTFSLNVPQNAQLLVFSSIGYQTEEVPVSDVVEVVMISESKQLGEVMVVAYGTAKKESFTGSAVVVKSEDIVKTSGGLAKAIQGKVAGVQVVGSEIRIRGFGSFTADGTPLYVVDGIVGAPQPRDEDIETFTVLKDASSTALYGSRAANGVIIITSKKGKKDKEPEFNLKYQRGISEIIKPDYDLMSADQHFRITWLGLKNGSDAATAHANLVPTFNGNNPYNMDQPFDDNGNLKPGAKLLYSTDWQKESLQKGISDRLDLSVMGGSEKSSYYWSLGYTNEEGLAKIDYTKSIQSLLNFSNNLNKNVEIGVSTTIGYSQFGDTYLDKGNENNLIYVSRVITPAAPLYQKEKVMNLDGTWTYRDVVDVSGNRVYDWNNPNYKAYNPVALMDLDPQSGYSFRTFVAPWTRIKLLEGLTFNGNASARLNTDKKESFQNPFHGSGETEKGLSTKEAYHSVKWNTHASLRYAFSFAEMHNLETFIGVEKEVYKYEDFYASANGYPLGDISTELSVGQKPRFNGSTTTESGILSYISFLKYNFNNKYYVDGSFRRDGSSKFGENKRWGNFWSVGFSWRLSEEQFIKEIDWINSLKYRVSYGVTGTDAIDPYKYGDYYSLGANYQGKTGIVHTNLPNSNLGWEQNNSFSTGIDFAFFNRINGTVEYYNKVTKDLLMEVPLPTTTGFSSIFKNIGEMKNQGIELEVNVGVVDRKDLKWNASLTNTFNVNTIESLPQKEIINGTKRYVVGHSLYDFYMREWAGVDPANGDALWYMDQTDVNGNITKVTTNNYDNATRYMVGRSTPDVISSLSTSLEYKGFDLSVQLYGSFGGKVYDGEYAALMHDGASKVEQLCTDALDSWTTPGVSAKNPIYVVGNTSSSSATSTRFLVDGTYYKLKNVTVGYTIPNSLTKVIGVTDARVFATGDNLYIISDFKSGDPEKYLSGLGSNIKFPNTRVFRFGVSVKF